MPRATPPVNHSPKPHGIKGFCGRIGVLRVKAVDTKSGLVKLEIKENIYV
jgi:hypothetical protein